MANTLHKIALFFCCCCLQTFHLFCFIRAVLVHKSPFCCWQLVMSSGKNGVALVVGMLVDRGLLDYGAKVAKYWPDFGQNGKQDLTIADLMRHEAGLHSLDHPLTAAQLSRASIKANQAGRWLALETPHWSQTTRRAYHGLTRALFLNEVVRRVDPKGIIFFLPFALYCYLLYNAINCRKQEIRDGKKTRKKRCF